MTLTDALTLASSLGLSRFLAKDATAQGALLLLATLDVDGAGPYQGRKYDLTPGAQEREFPRMPYGEVVSSQWPVASVVGNEDIWDVDSTGAVVVPAAVKMAVLLQADSLCEAAAQERLAAIRGGLKGQSVGDASETYATAAELAAAGLGSGLCPRAAKIMDAYRLKSGRLL